MNGRLHDKVAIVTGGGTGIGEAICRTFAREGAKVVVNGLPGDPIDDVVSAIREDGGTAIPFAGDVSVDAQARACVAAAIEEYGQLDVLINNAGVLLVGAEIGKIPVEQPRIGARRHYARPVNRGTTPIIRSRTVSCARC